MQIIKFKGKLTVKQVKGRLSEGNLKEDYAKGTLVP